MWEMCRAFLLAAALLAGCKAELGNGGGDDNLVVDGTLAVDGPLVDAPAADAPVDARVCAGGDARATDMEGSCLVLFGTPRTWSNASAACMQLGARLLVIDDADTDLVARTLAGTKDVFVGLTDVVTENTFVWVDGTPLGYTNWRTGEPNDGNGNFAEDCGIINGVRGGQWDDRPCATDPAVGVLGEYPYLCQY